MNFEEAIKPVTELLLSNGFSIQSNRHNLIEYSSKSTQMRIAYSHLEYSFNTFVGQSLDTLIELTPKVVENVFKDDAFKFQANLTIENLIFFLKSSGKYLLLDDTIILKRLDDYSLEASKNYTLQIIKRQNIDQADKAWIQKDYASFVKCIDQIPRDLLQPSYLKKYKIAVEKINK